MVGVGAREEDGLDKLIAEVEEGGGLEDTGNLLDTERKSQFYPITQFFDGALTTMKTTTKAEAVVVVENYSGLTLGDPALSGWLAIKRNTNFQL